MKSVIFTVLLALAGCSESECYGKSESACLRADHCRAAYGVNVTEDLGEGVVCIRLPVTDYEAASKEFFGCKHRDDLGPPTTVTGVDESTGICYQFNAGDRPLGFEECELFGDCI